jgi:hypothetical protein
MPQELIKPPPPLVRKGIRWNVIIWATIAVSVIYWVLVPPLTSAKRAAAQSKEEGYVRTADLALIDYANDHEGRYPRISGDMAATLKPYLHDQSTVEAMSRFVWNDNLSEQKRDDVYDERQWILYSHIPGTSMFMVGFEDGSTHYAARGYLDRIIREGDELLKTYPPDKN